jgi:hypothetical protein
MRLCPVEGDVGLIGRLRLPRPWIRVSHAEKTKTAGTSGITGRAAMKCRKKYMGSMGA